MRRRSVAAALLAACAVPAWAADPVAGLLAEGEQALQAGDAVRALQAFERAASMRHDPVAEWGMVRSWMQSGEYRRALAFAAHAAEGHAEMPEGAGLYAWLLYVGGQKARARAVLAGALQFNPGNAYLRATDQRLQAPAAALDGCLLEGPTRQAPCAQPNVPCHAHVVASGLLLPAGDSAVVPTQAIDKASALWVRDALGRTVSAQVLRVLNETGLAELALDAPLRAAVSPWAVSSREPFAGSPEMAIEFVANERTPAEAAWPLLQLGFVGRWQSAGTYELGADLVSNGPQGGPVYDGAGLLIGVALRGHDGRNTLRAASALRAAWPSVFGVPSADAPRVSLSPDAIYESAMSAVVQVIAASRVTH